MGELLAIVSMTLFAAANISIGSKHKGRVSRGGAFLSIVITFALSFSIWLGFSLSAGFAAVDGRAIAWFALAGLLTALVGRIFLYASIRHLGAVRGAAIKRLNPFFSVLLGVTLLGELVSLPMAIGMALIVASFAVLIRESLRAETAAQRGQAGSIYERIANLGYLQGPVSALAYASGYVARKQGLLIVSDPALGTMIGAGTGILLFLLLALGIDTLRSDLRATFTELNPWLWLAGLFTSCGQLIYFAALQYTTISKIALITSMEVFVTMFLTRLLLPGERRISRDVWLAALLGVIGTLLVIRY
ncbi:MAG TPA: EamA family transporter [Gammaproteobacteria bacterium]|nr:EamA family transporter [Gammaproteobacteria bacterium]